MGWGDRVRRIVNRKDYVGPWRLAVLRVVDPVEWYMRKHDEENVRPLRRRRRRPEGGGWTAYAPLGDVPPEREVRLAQEAEDRERRRAEARQRRELLNERYASFLENKARELLQGRSTRIHVGEGVVQARLVRFRTGAVFEHHETSPTGTGHGMARIERSQLAEAVPVLVGYLENAVVGQWNGLDPIG
ncbi:MAG TPA: hypothetical protein VGB19_11765 [Actinomycetota bacterium]